MPVSTLNMQKILIIDAVNFIFRSYHAIAPMTGSEGQSTHALFGFIRSLLKVMKDFPTDYIVAVFDGPNNKKSRTELYKDYKAQRKVMPEDLYAQIKEAVTFCELMRIPSLMIPDVEADDTIGSLVTWINTTPGIETYICTSDKDLCQLVSDSTFLLHTHKENAVVDKKKVEELFEVTPEQIVDYLALIGDASDNIPGVAGIGPKTASTLLKEFHTLESILLHASTIKGKKGELLVQGKENALLSKQLASLNTKVEVPKDWGFYKKDSPLKEELVTFYQKHRFFSFLKENPSQEKEDTTNQTPTYTLIANLDELPPLLALLQKQKSLCFSIKANRKSPLNDTIAAIAIGYSPKEAWYIPISDKIPKKSILTFLHSLFSTSHLSFFGHNIKYDLHVLLNEGLSIPKLDFDTMLASYLLTPHIPKHSLEDLCIERFSFTKINVEDLIGKGKSEIPLTEVPVESAMQWACQEIDFTIQLKNLFSKELQTKNLTSVFFEIELPLLPVLLTMERKGMFLDILKITKLSQELAEKISSLEKTIHSIAGETFNVSSPKQLSTILFEKMQLKPPKKTQTGFSTSAETLESLANESPIIEKILLYRQLEKLRSTYTDSLPTQINRFTGRIHCTFSQTTTATGRLSCVNPNLQNIPVRTEEGKKIREAFRPAKEGWSYVSADYSQIELRLLAHLSEDPSLITAFTSGEDVHTYTASLIFNIPLDEVTPDMRYKAKAVNFGILYGQQAFGLSQELQIEQKQAAKFIETYFERYAKVKDYIELCKKTTIETGFSTSMTGRIRPIPEIQSKNQMLKSLGDRLAVNTPLQGTAADLIKLAMIHIYQKWPFKESFCILQIHDELLFECIDHEIPSIIPFIKKEMEDVFSLKVPLIVDISVGKNWGEC